MTLNALFASDIIHNGITFGRLNIEKAGISQSNEKKIFNILDILTLFNQNNSEEALKKLTNFNPQYAALKKIIERLIFIKEQGGYVQIPQGKTIKVGQSNPVIPFVRQYLKQNGYVIDKVDGLVFDTYLEKLVKEFQKTRGINANGIIGSQTYKALNESVNTHIIAVIANFERIRRASPYPSQKYIRVNVPETMLYLFDKHHNENLSMRAIVGRIDRPTPIFNDIIDYIDFNPYWNVPHSIATKDILPLLKKNSLYGQNKGIYIYQKNKVINPRKINWKRYSEEYFPFSLRQEPGYKNALGTVKFIFPNKFAVYLHDTPSKNGFSRISRFLSSGCVRVQSPKALANSLLHGQLSPVQINHIFKK